MEAATTPAWLVIQPWFKDHHFNGITMLPAVEALEFLAQQVHARFPGLQYRQMATASFPRFLELMPGQPTIEVWVTCAPLTEGTLKAALQTKKQLKAMTRLISHCEVLFGMEPMATVPCPPSPHPPVMEIEADRLYRDLVPFGPMYRSLRGQIQLESTCARGLLEPPLLPGVDRPRFLLGSPFAMDGAMHLACVHGQRLVDFIPFPVGFTHRSVHAPTHATTRYEARAHLQRHTAQELVYDLEIVDHGQVQETIQGLRMRDISGGRLKPAAWIRRR